MITAYLLIAMFFLGALIGSITASGEKPARKEWVWVFLISLFWPVMGYVYWQDWRKGA